MAPAKQYKIAGETLYIYAPLAHRLGLFEIKTELEDLSFKYEHPKAYERISELIRQSEARRSEVYNDFSTPIKHSLDKMNLHYEAKARLKSVYSIWRKMETKHVPFEEVYDLYAMRIIFDCDDPAQEKAICWSIYSAITDLYRLHPDRTRDWVSIPKANGYQALHLTVMGPDGNWVEVQIRSRRMDEIAEKGFAAHWKYKAFELHSEIGSHCIAGKVNHKLVPLSHRLQSGDQVEVLTSQSQTPKEEWLPFLATAKGRTRLKAALRRVQQPVIDNGKAILDQYFKEREVEATNEIVTKMLAYYHLPSRDALYMKLGQGAIDLSRYILKESPKTEKSLLSKLFRIKRSAQQPEVTIVTPEKIDMKQTYALRCTDTERNGLRQRSGAGGTPLADMPARTGAEGHLRAAHRKHPLGAGQAEIPRRDTHRGGRPSRHTAGTHPDDIQPAQHRHTQPAYRHRQRGVRLLAHSDGERCRSRKRAVPESKKDQGSAERLKSGRLS